MTQIHWLNDVSGSFTNPADWSGGAVPRSADDAILDPAGVTPFTVSLTTNAEVNSIQTDAEATLAITGKLFRAVNGTGAGVNAGTISVGDHSVFRVDGAFDNTGTVSLGNLMTSGSGSLTLSGGGSVVEDAQLSRSSPHGRLAGADLTNVDNTITGGQLNSEVGLYIKCSDVLTNEAKGVIANRTAKVYVNHGEIDASTIYNAGKIDNTGGDLQLSAVYLDNSGTISNALGQGLFLDCSDLVSTGEIKLGANHNFGGIYADTFFNSGILSNPGQGFLAISSRTASSVFTNDGYIVNSGAGQTGVGGQGAINNVGTILASGGYLNIGGGFGNTPTIANSGLLEATGTGRLAVHNPFVNTGQVEVAGGSIVLEGAVTGAGAISIAGGTLEFSVAAAANVQFTQASGELRLDDSQEFSGTVSGFSATGGTSLDLRDIAFTGPAEASFSGNAMGGVLTVNDGSHIAHIQLAGDYLSTNFLTSADGAGGVLVTASGTTTSHGFVSAMASFAPEHAAGARSSQSPAWTTAHALAVPLA